MPSKFFQKANLSQAVVAHAFSSSSQEAKAGDLCEFRATLVYKARSRIGSKDTQRNLVSKK